MISALHGTLSLPLRVASSGLIALVFGALSVLPVASRAQVPGPADSLIVPGAHLRLALVDAAHPVRGRLREVRGDTLFIDVNGTRTTVPAAQVAGVQVQRRASTLSRNVTLGGVIGMLGTSGMYLGWCANNRDACRQQNQSGDHHYADDDHHDITMGAVVVIGGALLGSVVGYALTPTEWVDAGAPLRVGTTRDGAIRISGSLTFR